MPPISKSILEYIEKISRNDKILFLNPTYEEEIKQIIGQLPNKTAVDMIILVIYCWKKKHAIIKPLNFILIFQLTVQSSLILWK